MPLGSMERVNSIGARAEPPQMKASETVAVPCVGAAAGRLTVKWPLPAGDSVRSPLVSEAVSFSTVPSAIVTVMEPVPFWQFAGAAVTSIGVVNMTLGITGAPAVLD